MRKTLLLTLILLATLSSFAQGFTNYKAIIADDSGTVLSEQPVTVRFTVFDNDPSTTGVQVFQETQITTTDANGILVLNIGEENPMDWFAIDWSIPRQYLQVEYDTGSGFVDMGTQVLNSVPYSEYAFKAQNSIYAEHADEVDFSNITNVPAGLSDGDDDTQLTETQVDDYVANNGYLSTEVDGDVTNELQTISKTGSTVTLSDGGGSFTDDNTQLTETQVDDYVANNGYATILDELSDAKSDSDGSDNGSSIFIGVNAGINDNSNNNKNVGVGYEALTNNSTGYFNTANGYQALSNNSIGANNTANGYQALSSNNTGLNNTANGSMALFSNTLGKYNTAIGTYAGFTNQTGSGNVFLGFRSGYNETGSNKLYIENSNSDTPLIGGDFATDEVTINGSIAIKDGTQGENKVLTSDADGNASWETVSTPTVSKTINYHPSGFNTSNDYDLNLITNFTYILSSETTSKGLFLPLNLPSGATITNIKFYYKDNSTSDLQYVIRRNALDDSSQSNVYVGSTSGASDSVRYLENTANIVLLSDSSYTVYVYNVNGSWSSLNVYSVSVTYEE